MKFNRLFKQDFKIVENKKKVFLIPAIVLVIALICGIIFGVTRGSALNLGMDFTGGYSVTVTFGTNLTDETYEKYSKVTEDTIEGLTDEDGKKYGIEISSIQRQGEADTASLLVKYQAVASETKMEEINDQLRDELLKLFTHAPTISLNADKTEITADYNTWLIPFKSASDSADKLGDWDYVFRERLIANDIDVKALSNNGVTINGNVVKIALNAPYTGEESLLVDTLIVSDTMGGQVADAGTTSASVSDEILKSAILAISISLVLMLIYIIIRFELLSGIAAVAALAHDVLIMFAFMIIFQIEINSTFIAALITILGYSINNTIIIFDRVRENMRIYAHKRDERGKKVKPAYIANKSVQETIWRSINTTLTTLIMIGMIAILGVTSVQVFALPIIFGLLAGTFSSVCLAPTLWAMLAKTFPGAIKAPKAKRNTAAAEK